VTEKEQEIVTQKELIKQGEIDKKELKALNLKTVTELTKLKGEIQILKDSISHNGNVVIVTPCDSIGKPKPMIELPFTFKEINKDYSFTGGFDIKGKMNINLSVPLDLDIIAGIDKETKKYKAVVTSTNPVIKIITVSSFKLDEKKPLKWGVGFIGGYGINISGNVKTQPFLGVGLSYNLIRF
jgi:hypothetical protein